MTLPDFPEGTTILTIAFWPKRPKDERRATVEILVDMAHAWRIKPELEKQLRKNEYMRHVYLALFVMVLIAGVMSGCARAAPSEVVTAEIKQGKRASRIDIGVPVFTDPATGCEYLGYTGHGLTPRMGKKFGAYEHLGCRRMEQ